MTLAPRPGRADLEVRTGTDRDIWSSVTSASTSAIRLLHLDLFAGGDPVLLAAGFYDRVHLKSFFEDAAENLGAAAELDSTT